jgi:aspartate racemase
MEEEFYRGRLRDRFGLEAMVPGEHDRAMIHRVIYEEAGPDSLSRAA